MQPRCPKAAILPVRTPHAPRAVLQMFRGAAARTPTHAIQPMRAAQNVRTIPSPHASAIQRMHMSRWQTVGLLAGAYVGGPIGGAVGILGGSVVDYVVGGRGPQPQGGTPSSTAPLVAPQQQPTTAAANTLSQTPPLTPTTTVSSPAIAPSIATTAAVTTPTAVPFDRRAAISRLQAESAPRRTETPVATSNGWEFFYHKHQGENGYHIKVDGGSRGFFGVNVWPNGTFKNTEPQILASLKRHLNVGDMIAASLLAEARRLLKSESAIRTQITFIR